MASCILLHPVVSFQSISGLLKRWKSQILVAARGKGAAGQRGSTRLRWPEVTRRVAIVAVTSRQTTWSLTASSATVAGLLPRLPRPNFIEFICFANLCHRDASDFSWSYCTPGTVEILAEAITTDAQRVGMLLLFGTRLEVQPRCMWILTVKPRSTIRGFVNATSATSATQFQFLGPLGFAGKPYGSVDWCCTLDGCYMAVWFCLTLRKRSPLI
jgi:hypothetical protein